MARSSPRPSIMACSFCAPQLQDDDAMVAQELDQLVSTVLTAMDTVISSVCL
jgi:hypothetical protein